MVFATGREDEASVALAVVAYAYIFFAVGVELQFVVSSAIAVYFNVPAFGLEFA